MNRNSKSLFNLLGCCDPNQQLRTSKITQAIISHPSQRSVKQSTHSFSFLNISQQKSQQRSRILTPNISSIPAYSTFKQTNISMISNQNQLKNMNSRTIASPNPVRAKNLTINQKVHTSNQVYQNLLTKERNKAVRLQIQNNQLKIKLNIEEQKLLTLEKNILQTISPYVSTTSNHKLNLIDSINSTIKQFQQTVNKLSHELQSHKNKNKDKVQSVQTIPISSLIQPGMNTNCVSSQTISNLLSQIRKLNQQISQLRISNIKNIYTKQQDQRQKQHLIFQSQELNSLKLKHLNSIKQIQKLMIDVNKQKQQKQQFQTQLRVLRSRVEKSELINNQLNMISFSRVAPPESQLNIKQILQIIM